MVLTSQNLFMMSKNNFFKKYTPVKNILFDSIPNKEALKYPFVYCMYDTIGISFQHIVGQPKRNVWTVIDGEGVSINIVAGLRYTNRLGYFITEEEWSNESETFKL